MTNQEGRHGVVRTATSTTENYNGDFNQLFDDTATVQAAGTFNERLLSYINVKLSASHTNINDAMQAFADNESRNDWDSMETFTA
jgi:hypothetical protein